MIQKSGYFTQRKTAGFYEVVLSYIKFLITNKNFTLVKVKLIFCPENLIPDIFLKWSPGMRVSFRLKHLHLFVCNAGVCIQVWKWHEFPWESLKISSGEAGMGSQASFTIPAGSRAARDTRQHQPQILDASQGMRLGRGWAHLSKAHSPWLGRAGLWEAGFQLCCGILGQGLMAPRDWWGVLCSGQDEGEIFGKLGRDI